MTELDVLKSRIESLKHETQPFSITADRLGSILSDIVSRIEKIEKKIEESK